MEKFKCRICGNINNNRDHKIKEMMFGTAEVFDYIRCSKCETIQIKNIPSDIGKYYSFKDYYSFSSSNEIFYKNRLANLYKRLKDNLILFGIHKFPNFLKGKDDSINEGLNALLDVKGLNKNISVLDIGCGSGVLLYRLRNAGFKNLTGIDPFLEKDIINTNSLKILKKSIDQINQSYDLIIMSHSLEHVNDPTNFLKTVSKILNKNGTLLIRIPLSDSYSWNLFKENWFQLDAPRHLHIFTKKSMKIMSDKLGFELYKLKYDSHKAQFIASIQYINNIPLNSKRSYFTSKDKSIFKKFEIKYFQKKSIHLNKEENGDQACFYYKKV